MPAHERLQTSHSDSDEESATKAYEPPPFNPKAAFAEFLASMMFVIIGCGVACNYGASTPETKLVVAFAFGIGILVLAYATGHLSGGQINGAVTFSLVISGEMGILQGVSNVFGQLLGSTVGAIILEQVISCENDMTTNLGSNIVSPKYGITHALLGEALGTFLLCMVVFETAISPASRAGANACLAIGFSVFLAHLLLLPIDGCSINPTRSFGPAVISKLRGCANYGEGGLRDLWVMCVGPLIGASIAAITRLVFKPAKRG